MNVIKNYISIFKNKISINYANLIELKNNNQSDLLNDFILNSLHLIENTFNATEYKDSKKFLREIKLLMYYTFEILKDDYYIGDALLYKKLPFIDNYIFSQYRNKLLLQPNIEKLSLLAYSNRFKTELQPNLLSYYVFLEQSGIEITKIFDDFYTLLVKIDNNNNKNKKKIYDIEKFNQHESFINTIFLLSNIKKKQIHKLPEEKIYTLVEKYYTNDPITNHHIEVNSIKLMEESLYVEREIMKKTTNKNHTKY